MPSRPRQPRQPKELTLQIVPLLLLGIGLVSTNNSITIIDDESKFLNYAVEPVRQTLADYFSGNGAQPHPPLFDILMHFWLRWTGGYFDYLRIPSILFFIAGIFLLGRACIHFAGLAGSVAVSWLGVLWPFGFLFGRMAVWYSFSFFLVSGLTLAYLKYLEGRTFGRWLAILFFAVALVWTTYLGWAFLACLAVDRALRRENTWDSEKIKDAAALAGGLALSYIPIFRSFWSTMRLGVNVHERPLTILANAAFSVFSLFTSESIAPWVWKFSVPAGIAILFCVAVAAWWVPKGARRFFLYGAFLIALMAVTGILNTKRLLEVAPWVLLPIGSAIETTKPRWATFGLAIGLLAIGLIGWYGIYAKRYYSAPRFIEPWQQIAGETASKIGMGATVIADHPSFLFYLTYNLRVPRQNGLWKFEGVLPETVHDPRVFEPEDWLAAGHPMSGKMIIVRGGRDPGDIPIDEAARQLDQACGSISSQLRMRDEGYQWKQRFFPDLGEPQWRIEVREYDCGASSPNPPAQAPTPPIH